MIDLHDPAERDTTAGEYVLGTLAPDDHAAVEAALPTDALLRAAVYAWQDRLLAMSSLADSALAPEAAGWARIDAALGATAAPPTRAGPPAAPAPPPAPRWWQRLPLWQGLGSGALAAALVMGVLLVQQRPESPATRYVALLQSPADQSTGWIVELQADRVRLVPTASGAPVPAGRSLQFWTKLDGAAGPTSLGLVRAGQPLELPLSRLPGVGPRQLFEITLEPEGGSTIGRPTGPILFVGRTVAL